MPVIRALSLIFIVAAAGLLWLQVQHNEREYTSLQSLYKWCFDDSQSNETRIKACAVNYEAGHNKSHEALDQLLSLYAQNDNFNEGAQRVNAAIEGGLDAPRWLFWQAYFNEKRSVDQPPMTELIAQTKDHPQFVEDQRSVWSQVEDKLYVMAQLAILEKEYGQELWAQRQRGWLLGEYGHIQEGFEILERLVETNPQSWDPFEDFIVVCYEYPEQCPQLSLVPEEQKLTFTCETAFSEFKRTAKDEPQYQRIHKISGRPIIEAFNIPELIFTQAIVHYGVELLKFFKLQKIVSKDHAIRILSLRKLMSCYEKKHPVEGQTLETFIEGKMPILVMRNEIEFIQRILKQL